VLPSNSKETQRQLAKVQQELAPMEAQQAQMGRQAAWRQRGILWGGLASQGLLYSLLFRMTFYEL